MDDQRFDDIIRDKIGEYEAPGFDPAALSGLHYRMAMEYTAPWYVRYRSEVLVGVASVVIAMILLWGQWKIGDYNNHLLHSELADLQNQNKALAAMQEQLNAQSKVQDTIRIVEYRSANDQHYVDLMNELQALKRQMILTNTSNSKLNLNTSKQLLLLGKEQDLPSEVLASLNNRHNVIRDGEYLFVILDDNVTAYSEPYLRRKRGVQFNTIKPEYELVIDTTLVVDENFISKVQTKPVQISIRQLKELEKHYQKGIGIEVGPAVELYRTLHQPGTTSSGAGGGLLVNFITSPTLSFETGAMFTTYFYDVPADDVSQLDLPAQDQSLGELNRAEITSWLLEIPLNLKYRYRLSQNSHLMLGAGLTPLLYTKQKVEHYYSFDGGNGQFIPVESSNAIKGAKGYLGLANVSLGLSNKLNNNKRLETSLFYKHSIGTIGSEQVNAQYFGVSGAYMFTLK